MNSRPLSGDYFLWLALQIRDESDDNQDRGYSGLLTIMHEKEFVWHVPNDGNRLGDGLDLRVVFCREQNVRIRTRAEEAFLAKDVPIPPCSFLEVLIGLSRRLAFTAGGSAEGWAWRLMTNLGLERITDPVGRGRAARAHDILDACIHRTYSPSGEGGFFPLSKPLEDQTEVEIWYQMAAYINEWYEEG